MRMGNKGPHGRPWIWLMAVIVVCLAPAMDSIAADITVTALPSGRWHPAAVDGATCRGSEPAAGPLFKKESARYQAPSDHRA